MSTAWDKFREFAFYSEKQLNDGFKWLAEDSAPRRTVGF